MSFLYCWFFMKKLDSGRQGAYFLITKTHSYGKASNEVFSYYRPQTKFAKVMFLQVSVCPHWGGACVVLFGGCVWFYSGGVHGFIRGACIILFGGGMHGFIWGGVCGCSRGGVHGCFGGCAWLLPGGMRGCLGGACVVSSMRYGQ